MFARAACFQFSYASEIPFSFAFKETKEMCDSTLFPDSLFLVPPCRVFSEKKKRDTTRRERTRRDVPTYACTSFRAPLNLLSTHTWDPVQGSCAVGMSA